MNKLLKIQKIYKYITFSLNYKYIILRVREIKIVFFTNNVFHK